MQSLDRASSLCLPFKKQRHLNRPASKSAGHSAQRITIYGLSGTGNTPPVFYLIHTAAESCIMTDYAKASQWPIPGLLPLFTAAIDAVGTCPSAREEVLANICIDEKAFEREPSFASGGSFQVMRSRPNTLIKYVDSRFKMTTIHRLAMLHLNDVVLRVPKRTVDWNSKDGRDLSESICTEIAILRNEHLRRHENITNMVGICWGVDNDRAIMPVLVLETAQGGDLCKYLASAALDARDRLRLAIHCFQGLLALQTVGVIHADLKPENILVFIDEKGRPCAKLTDFGCSLLVTNIHEPIQLKSGTALWQSPTVLQAIGAQGLLQADIYSLTLVASLLLVGPFMSTVFDQADGSGDGVESLHKLKADDGALATFIRMQKDTNESSGPHVFTDRVSGLISEFFDSMLSNEDELQAGAALPVELLRTMLHQEIVTAIKEDPQMFETFDLLEEEVYFSHCVDIPLAQAEDVACNSTVATDRQQELDPEPVIPGLHQSYPEPSQLYTKEIKLGVEEEGHITLVPLAERTISINAYFSRLRRLPGRVTTAIITQIREIADSDSYCETSRSLAAYAMATWLIGIHRSAATSAPSLREAGQYLLTAAKLGHEDARASLGQALAWIGMPNPIDPKVEEGWLYDLALHGDRRSLKRLSSERRGEVFRDQLVALSARIREEADISATSDRALSESNQLEDSDKLRGQLPLICRYLVNQSWNVSLQNVLELPGLNPDLCTSLLMQACQKGDYRIAKVLIEHDAPLRDETSGLTPLHFLAHFGDGDILPLARLLTDKGADLEARCSLATLCTVGQLDLKDTLTDATPLLCAVAQSSITAVSVLVSLGADPFNGAEKYEPYTGTMPAQKRGRTYSPVHYAARLHMSDVLEVLLPEGKEYEQLLDWMCYETHSLKVTPLWCAVDYWYQGLYDRVLLHGKDHIKRCEETITFLLKRGAQGHVVNWDVTTQVKHSIFTAATLYGQPFVLNHLRSLDIQPLTKNLIRTLQTALDVEDLTAVEYLLPLAERETRDSESAFQLQASIQGHKLADFISHLYDIKERLESNARSKIKLDLIRDPPLQETIGPDVGEDILQQKASQGGFKMSFTIRPGPGGRSIMEPVGEPSMMPPQGTPLPSEAQDSDISAFEKAVMGGYEARARELYESEQCDVSCRRVDEDSDETTLLARLIRKSRKYSNFDKQILFLLDLTPPSDEEFFRACIPSGSTDNEGLSILHMSVMLDECPTNFKPRAPRQLISAIIEKYPESEYLNAVNSEFGTAVHVAVECGNLDALKELEDEDVEWNLLNSYGETPLDITARRLLKVHEFLQQCRHLQRLEKPDEYKEAISTYRTNEQRMKSFLQGMGGKYERYNGLMHRKSETEWDLENFAVSGSMQVNVAEHLAILESRSTGKDEPSLAAHMRKLRAWSELGVDECMLHLADGTSVT
ncbi:CAMK DCAMKL kinase [Fusarium tjaetaba]|uniref:CAMK DCAMKL kinase n=1 Tax=Fusarium tjaetaba TaxID=1567544 RepID=A0A8H5QWH0_9HYPO|nr:CAMK DCAMKL kinase [Fusarium tjaetaba]KAF5622108.1 CAMK DCAMKL kinase [Fusarium tjaetaba]